MISVFYSDINFCDVYKKITLSGSEGQGCRLVSDTANVP